jgi:hypothetical protein
LTATPDLITHLPLDGDGDDDDDDDHARWWRRLQSSSERIEVAEVVQVADNAHEPRLHRMLDVLWGKSHAQNAFRKIKNS